MDANHHNTNVFLRVGDWTVEPELGRVRSGDSEASLQPQVMELLVFMAHHPGEVLSIERLIDEVWHGKPMTTGSVYNALNTLRKTFGDNTDEPKYIETIPRRGYRLIADVQSGRPASVTSAPEQKISRKTTILGVVLVVLLGVWLYPIVQPGPESPAPEPELPEKSIAVLPFMDMSPEGDQAYFAEGVSEEILNVISRHPDLKVVGRSSSFQFRDEGLDLKAVGRQLGVAHLLEGSVRRDGARLRITAQLIETNGGYHLWSETFDADAGDVFRVQDEVAQKIAEQLQLAVLGENAVDLSSSSRAPRDIGAYDHYLLARYRINLGGKENIEEAIDHLEQALDIDPQYAQAHVEMAYALHGQVREETGSWGAWTDEAGERIVQQAEMALSLDPNLSGAYAIQATLNYISAYNGKNLPESAEQASRQFKRALALNPNDGRALLWSSGLHRLQGKSILEAVDRARLSSELEPLLTHATDYYLWSISELADRDTERWQMVEQLASGSRHWEGDVKLMHAMQSFVDGDLSSAFGLELQLAPGENELALNQVVQFRFHSMTRLALGAPELLARVFPEDLLPYRWIDFGSPMAEMLFPGHYQEMCGARNWRTTHRINSCVAFGLRAGQHEWLESYLPDVMPKTDLEFLLQFRHTFYSPDNLALSFATLARINDDEVALNKYLAMIDEFLDEFLGNPPAEHRPSFMTRAHIHALRGDTANAVHQLNRALDTGERMFVHFMHPAFDGIREHPGFTAVMERWIGLINSERAELGMAALTLSPDAGPGRLPFGLVDVESY